MRLIDPKNISSRRYKEACDDFECGWNACINEIMECVKQIEAEPVRHGRWVKAHGMMPPEFFGRHKCSLCGHFALSRKIGHEELSNYCPNCGAKMDKKVED